MTIAKLLPEGRQRYYNNDGTPCAGGKVYTYLAGTTTPKVTYSDAAGTSPNTNPVQLDTHGEALIFWAGTYKVDVKQADGQQVTGYPVDNQSSDPTGLDGLNDTLFSVLPTGDGAGKIGFLQSGLNAVLRTLLDKGREVFSLNDFGGTDSSTDSGVTNGRESGAAEVKGLAAATTARSIFRSLWTYKIPRRGMKVWTRTFGIFNQAATVSITDGPDDIEPVTGVLGFTADSDVSVYSDRDHVALFVQNIATAALVTTASTTFTANSVTSAAFATALAAKAVKIGMHIDTGETPTKKTGTITGWNTATNTINVSGWYIVDGTRNLATPAAGTTVNVNPSTKVWALNANVIFPPEAQAATFAGFELGALNTKVDGAGYLYDAVNLGDMRVGTAFQSRGKFVEGVHVFSGTNFGVIVNAAAVIGFYHTGGATAFQADVALGVAFKSKGSANALIMEDATGLYLSSFDGIGRWNRARMKLGVYTNGQTIDDFTVVALATGMAAGANTVNLPALTTVNSERTIWLKNSAGAAAPAVFVGVSEGGGGGFSVAAGACIQVISLGNAWAAI